MTSQHEHAQNPRLGKNYFRLRIVDITSSILKSLIVKFTRKDTRNSFYTNERKLIDEKASDLPDLGISAKSKEYISESLTSYKKGLVCEVNKLRKRMMETYLDSEQPNLC